MPTQKPDIEIPGDAQSALAGPWSVVVAGSASGQTYLSFLDAVKAGEQELEISIRRASALPQRGFLPGSCDSADIAYIRDVSVHDEPGEAGWTRYCQMMAMFRGLSTIAESAHR